MSDLYEKLLKGNKEWVAKTLQLDPDFFKELAGGQHPDFLWIGCSDSRVPATQLTDLKPGDMFVHRNIANVVVHTDANLLSVVFYAVKVLEVKHVIVCGHYGCGGVKAALGNDDLGYINNWLGHIKDVYRVHQDTLDQIADEPQRFDKFVELNVEEQVKNLAKVSFIQEAWRNRNGPQIHGWVYDISNGIVKDLKVTISSAKDLEPQYRYEYKD